MRSVGDRVEALVLVVACAGLLLAGCDAAPVDPPASPSAAPFTAPSASPSTSPSASPSSATESPAAQPELRTPEERFSYGLGARLGGDVRKSGHSIEPGALVRGFQDGLAGASALSDDEIVAALQQGVELRQAREQELREERARSAEEEGRAFLARNRERPGVVELASGVQYEVLRAGSGATPTVDDFVTCHARGTLLDGTVFDDSAEQGRPRSFAVTSVIDGLEEALLLMQPGAHWKVWVPAELAYGAKGAGQKVPPHSVLAFEIEILSIGAGPAGSAGSAPHPG